MRTHVLATYNVVQRWVIGDRATQPEENIELEIFDHAKRLMHLSGLKNLPSHKSLATYFYLWESAGAHTKRGVQYVLYQCPLRNQCTFMFSLRVLTGRDFMELQPCRLHDSSCHENDGSKYLKYYPIVFVHDAAITVPQLSCAKLRRNMHSADSPSKQIEVRKFQQSVQHSVYII